MKVLSHFEDSQFGQVFNQPTLEAIALAFEASGAVSPETAISARVAMIRTNYQSDRRNFTKLIDRPGFIKVKYGEGQRGRVGYYFDRQIKTLAQEQGHTHYPHNTLKLRGRKIIREIAISEDVPVGAVADPLEQPQTIRTVKGTDEFKSNKYAAVEIADIGVPALQRALGEDSTFINGVVRSIQGLREAIQEKKLTHELLDNHATLVSIHLGIIEALSFYVDNPESALLLMPARDEKEDE